MSRVNIFFLFILSGPIFQFFSMYHSFHHGDTLILNVMSLQKTTFFYWGADRYFMTLPILASFFQNPSLNLFILTWLQVFIIFFGILSIFYLLSPENDYLGFSIFILILTSVASRLFFREYIYQAYSSSLFFSISAIFLFTHGLKPTATARMQLIAFMLSGVSLVFTYIIAQPIILLNAFWMPYILFTTFSMQRSRFSLSSIFKTRIFWVSSLSTCICAIILYIPISIYKANLPHTVLTLVDFNAWKLNIIKITTKSVKLYFMDSWLVLWGLVIGLLISIVLNVSLKKFRSYSYKIIICLICPATGIYLIMPSFTWVQMNGCNPRYIMVTFVLFLIAFILLLLNVINLQSLRRLIDDKFLSVAITIIAFFILMNKFGFNWNLKTPTDQIVTSRKIPVGDIRDCKCVAMTGSYWRVWPTVYAMNAIYPEDTFYGITYRSNPTISLWYDKVLEGYRVCFYIGDEKVPYMMKKYFSNSETFKKTTYNSKFGFLEYVGDH